MIKEKRIRISRHGIVPKDANGVTIEDTVQWDSSKRIYDTSRKTLGGYCKQNQVGPKNVLLRANKLNRTAHTANAIYLGALGIDPSENGVEKRPFMEDERLGDDGIVYNEDAVKSGKVDTDTYVRDLVANPTMNSYHGGKTTPFNEICKSRGQMLKEVIYELVQNPDLKLAVLGGQSGSLEAMAVVAVNTGRKTPVTSCEDIGGVFGMEDYADVVLTENGDGTYRARFERKNVSMPIDIAKLGYE
ncbi:MAG: hypothetical protein ABIH72_05320 [archaeon]